MNIWMSDGCEARCSRWYKTVYTYDMSNVGYVNKMQQMVQCTEYTYEMSNVGYVNIIKEELFKATSDTFIKSMY